MPGIFGTAGRLGEPETDFADAVATLDLLGRTPAHVSGGEEFAFAVASLPDAPLAGPYHAREGDVAGCFAGDLHDRTAVPWAEIFASARRDDAGWTDGADGHFAAAVYHAGRRRLTLFADHFGCHPFFYARHGGGLVFSTQLAAFVRLRSGGEFDADWFYRFLFYGYWPDQSTFLTGVRRLAPGTRLDFAVATGELTTRAYEPRFARREPPLRGPEAIEHARATFRRRVPPMFPPARPAQLALSAGMDSRTVYAFMPEGAATAAFTYGMAGCDDQREAAVTARRLGLPHRRLVFDAAYEADLPRAIHETVWLSGGLAWINRCMLPAVYRFVGEAAPPSPILSSGIALDTLFRGHNNARGDVHRLLATGEVTFGDPAYRELVPASSWPRFEEAVRATAADLTRQHGRLSQPESYLAYTIYTLCPSYFTADLEVGGHFATLRVPGYDRAIVRLAYDIEYSTIYLSKFLPHDLFDEYTLQASLMAGHPRLARAPLQGIPLDVYARRDRWRYQAYRLLKHGPRRLRRRFSARGERVPIEDWGTWFATVLAGEMRSLLRPGCRVERYVTPATIARYLAENRWPWLARVATAEIILQLLEDRWASGALEAATPLAQRALV